MAPAKSKKTVAEIVTETILKRMQEGTFSWHQAWNLQDIPRNYVSGKAYRGINLWLLRTSEYKSPFWLTYQQAIQAGGHVREGEHPRMIVFMKPNIRKVKELETGEEVLQFGKPVFRYYRVFNEEQCEGVPSHAMPELKMNARIETADRLYAAMGDQAPRLERGRPAYVPAIDVITMPDIKEYESTETYYRSLFHETGHWTGAKNRLAREGIVRFDMFGSHQYSKEELVAEFSAAMLASLYGFHEKILDMNVGYLQSWMTRLEKDPDLIIGAASQAQKAVEFVLTTAGTSWEEVLGEMKAEAPAAASGAGVLA